MDNKEKAKAFLESITPSDKIALVFHDDLDGFASGILLYDFLKKKGCKDITYFILGIGKNSIDDFNLKDRNKVIIADLGPNLIDKKLFEIKDKPILYIDHHKKDVQIPEEVIEVRTKDAFSASRSVFELVGGKDWLALAGMLADAGDRYSENTELIKSILKKYKFSLEEYKEKRVYPISEALLYFEGKFKEAFKIMLKINSPEEIEEIKKFSEPVRKEINKFVADYEKNKEKLGDANFYLFSPKYQIKSIVGNIISMGHPEEVFIFANPEKDSMRISARNQSANLDMANLLKETMKNIPNASSGGHLRAAGGFFQAKDLEKFKENLRNYKI